MFMANYYDQFLCESWNKVVLNSKSSQEQFWDICRMFEEKGYLIKNLTAVSTFSIGPFRIAANISLEKKDMLLFFAEVVIPILITESALASFEDKWLFVLLPLTHICINMLDKMCFVKDISAWKVLLYIKSRNNVNHFPTINDIKSSLHKKERGMVNDIIDNLFSHKSIITSSNALIENINNGYKSLV
jgi:hypothetical protein